jgi:hypothetical protein
MFAQCRVDDTTVEQDLGCVGDAVEGLQGVVELVGVVVGEGCHPGLDFLPCNQQPTWKAHSGAEGRRAPASET